MFEIASCSGSNSSESFVKISRSGASSLISTPSSTTNTTCEDKQRIYRLCEQNRNLESQLPDYRALKQVILGLLNENTQLQQQIKILKSQLPKMSSSSSPFSLVSIQAAEHSPGTLSQPDRNKMTQDDQKSLLLPEEMATPVVPSVSYPPILGPQSSLQETMGPPEDNVETKLISELVSKHEMKPLVSQQESIPREESLTPANSNPHPPSEINLLAAHKIRQLCSVGNETSAPDILQLDSDKYDESTYEKVGLQMATGHSSLTNSMYGAGGDRTEARPTDFPSLSSGMSNGIAQLSNHSSSYRTTGVYQSPTALTPTSQNSDLAAAVERFTERLNSEPGDSMPAIAIQMHEIAERVSKVEQKERDQKNLISTLTHENQELKRHLNSMKNANQAEVIGLREQITRQMQQLKLQNLKKQVEETRLQGSDSDWVYVDQHPHKGSSQSSSDHSLVGRVRKLELQNAELIRENSKWKSQWDHLEQNHQMKLSEIHSRMSNEEELLALKTRLAEQTSDFEAHMLEMKKRIGEEEGMKEEAQHQYRLAERTISELREQVTEMKTQLSDAAHTKQALTTELKILKAHLNGQDMQSHQPVGASSTLSQTALQNEIVMLKEQLKVFAEDFEHEREDRTSAQAARDVAKKNVESMEREKQLLVSRMKHLERQIKDRDDTIAFTVQQSEALQRQASDYKKKLAAEWEEKQNLMRMLALAQQKQQQQRNPYLTQESFPIYNPPSVYQPPSSVASPIYGAPGASPSRNRATARVVSPEHLPGAWTCMACTYINYPGRTVCECCGMVNNPKTSPDHFALSSRDFLGSDHHALLMSRGREENQGGAMHTNGDLVTDSTPDPLAYN